jgi:hypothetical protein
MASQALQVLAIERMMALLQALKTEGVLKEVYYTESAATQANETPYAYFRPAADPDYVPDNTVTSGPPWRYRVRSRLLLSVAIRRKVSYTIKELAEIEHVLRNRITSDFPDPPGSECRIKIIGLAKFADPWIADLAFRDFGAATLAVDYEGIDVFGD